MTGHFRPVSYMSRWLASPSITGSAAHCKPAWLLRLRAYYPQGIPQCDTPSQTLILRGFTALRKPAATRLSQPYLLLQPYSPQTLCLQALTAMSPANPMIPWAAGGESLSADGWGHTVSGPGPQTCLNSISNPQPPVDMEGPFVARARRECRILCGPRHTGTSATLVIDASLLEGDPHTVEGGNA